MYRKLSTQGMILCFWSESKATESGEVDKQSSYLMLTSSAGLDIIRHLQDNSLCELALQYLLQVRIIWKMVEIVV